MSGGVQPPGSPKLLRTLSVQPTHLQRTELQNKPPAREAPRYSNDRGCARSPGVPVRSGRRSASQKSKRLSATDISALASMKNVAKCDTWCELQNPVNHRVFERKLRPKPRLRARLPGCHTSLSLRNLRPSKAGAVVRMRKLASRDRASRMAQTRAGEAKRRGIRWSIQSSTSSAGGGRIRPQPATLNANRRDLRSGGATR